LRQQILELLQGIVSYRVIAVPTEYKGRNKSRGEKTRETNKKETSKGQTNEYKETKQQ